MAGIARFFGRKRNTLSEGSDQSASGVEKNNCKSKNKEKSSKLGKSRSSAKGKYNENDRSSMDGDSTDIKPKSKRFSSQEQQLNTSCCTCGHDKVSAAEMEYHPTENGTAAAGYSPNLRVAYMPVQQDSPDYNMNHPERGKAVIFNFDTWDNTNYPSLDLKPREGSKKDKRDLAKCFRELDFEVEEHNNLACKEFLDILDLLRNEDHSQNDCLVVAIMTHGERNTVYLRDGVIMPVNLIWERFEAHECPTLAGKPKIFIIQACRGKKYDSGTTLMFNRSATAKQLNLDVTDSGAFSYVIPNAADIIVAFSCPLGHYSWRSPEKGSWFIQAICKIFAKHGMTMELQALLTTVAREVALNYSSNTDNYDSHNKRQVTSTSSTLIRNVYFRPKPLKSKLRPVEGTDAEPSISTQVEATDIEEVEIGIDNMQMTSI